MKKNKNDNVKRSKALDKWNLFLSVTLEYCVTSSAAVRRHGGDGFNSRHKSKDVTSFTGSWSSTLVGGMPWPKTSATVYHAKSLLLRQKTCNQSMFDCIGSDVKAFKPQ